MKTSELLNEIVKNRADDEKITLLEINSFLHERGFALLLILFSFPMAIPLPYPPGFTTVLGIPLLFYAIQMMIGTKDPWLPQWVHKKTIKAAHLRIAITKSIKFFQFIEKIMRPRLKMLTSLNGERLIGLFVFLCSISIILPIWFGNAIPSLGIFIMSLGLLNEDGVTVILGMVVSVFGLFVAASVVMFGVAVVKTLFYKFTNIL